MLWIKSLLVCLCLILAAATTATAAATTATAAAPIKDPENTLVMQLKTGRVVIAMRPDLAPQHVARIKELVRKGFYDGTPSIG